MAQLHLLLFLPPLFLSIFASGTAEEGAYHKNGDSLARERHRRSKTFAEIGAAAAMSLLRGAAKVAKPSKGFNLFRKKGTAQTAYREFMNTVDKKNILRHTNKHQGVLEGRAGDRIIYFTRLDRKAGDKPTITIYSPGRTSGNADNLSDKIIYE